jgi:hypothetical protein
MIRRTFFRRLAAGAMAGMLGAWWQVSRRRRCEDCGRYDREVDLGFRQCRPCWSMSRWASDPQYPACDDCMGASRIERETLMQEEINRGVRAYLDELHQRPRPNLLPDDYIYLADDA